MMIERGASKRVMITPRKLPMKGESATGHIQEPKVVNHPPPAQKVPARIQD
jgi:hypothetical protein